MIRRLRILLIAGAAFVGACSDEHPPLPVAPTPPPSLSHVPMTEAEILGRISSINTQILALFPPGFLLTSAQLQFNAIAFDVKCANAATRTVPPCSGSTSMATYLKRAKGKVILQVWSTIKLYKAGALGVRSDPMLQDKVIAFIVSEANLVGIHVPNFSREVFQGDAATGTCTGGTAGGCTFTTSYKTAALHIPSDAIPPGVTVIVFIFRLADETPPVETTLNTYPLYYEVFMLGLDAFIGPGATFAACYYSGHPTLSPPQDAIDDGRLRIATADPTSPTGVHIFALARVPDGMFCDDRTHLPAIGSIDFTSPRSVARAAGSLVDHIGSKAIGFFAPRPLYATNLPVAGGGIRVLSPKFIVLPPLMTSTVITTSAPLAVVGEPVRLEASVSPAPSGSGSVEFFDGTAPLGTVPLLPNGTASLTVPSFSLRAHTLSARFNANSTHAPSSSATITQHTVQRYASLADFEAAVGGVTVQVQDFNGLAPGTPITSIIAGVLTVQSPFPVLGVRTCTDSHALFGSSSGTPNPRTTPAPTASGFNGFYDLVFSPTSAPRTALAFDIVAQNPATGPAILEITGVSTPTARFHVSNTSGSEFTPVFVGMIASQPLNRVIVNEGLETNNQGTEEICLDNFRVANVSTP